MSTSSAQSVSPPRPPKKKHWVLRILVGIVIVILLIALAVQIVLWTDLPRGIVVGQIEKQLSLRLIVKSLHTTWLGHTELSDVSISLPLADKAFLEVPTMKVKNTSLFGLMLGRAVEVQKIELIHPHLHILQDKQGGWNIAEVAELLARAGGKKTGEESAQTSSNPMMPDVHLVDGTITILDNKQRTLDLYPLRVEGYRDTAVSFKYDIELPPQLSITGRLVPGGNWAHELAIKLHDLNAWAKPWTKDFPDVVVDVNWRGAVTETGVGGRFELQRVSVGGKTGAPGPSATGALAASVAGGIVTIRPDNLVLQTGAHSLPTLKLAAGALTFNPTSKDVKAEQLLISLFGGAAKVNADYNLNTSAGRLDSSWEKLVLPNGMTHNGALSANIGRPFPDQFILDAHLTSTSDQKAIGWLANLGLRLNGSSFSNFDWTVIAEQIQAHRHDMRGNLDGLKMTGGLHGGTFSLASIGLPNKDLISGNASYHLGGDRSWEAHLTGQHWPFILVPGTELAFEFKVRGNDKVITVDDIVFKSPDAQISISGTDTFDIPKPLDIQVSINNAAPTQPPAALASNTQSKVVNGSIKSHLRLIGTRDPLDLEVLGDVEGRELDIRGHHLGDISLVISKQSHIDSNGVFIYTDSLSLLGGQWGIDSNLLFDTDLLKVNVDLKQVQLQQIAQFADQKNISGTIDGKMALLLPEINPNLNKMQMESSMTIKDLNANGVMVDRIDAVLALDKGYLKIDPIRLKRANGAGAVRVGMNLNDYRKIELNADFTKWPVDVQGVPAHLDASVSLPKALILLPDPKSGDVAQHQLRINADQITFHGATTYKGGPLGDIVAYAGITGRTFDLRGMHMKLFGGRLDGQAHADIDKLLSTTAEITWERLDFKELALMIPALKEFSGELTGSIRLAPTTVPHALEPLAIVIKTTLKRGYWRTLPIKDARIAAYLGTQESMPQSGYRIVLDDSPVDPNFIHLGDGTLELWGRTSTRGSRSTSLAQLRFRDMDLNKFVHAIEPSAADMPGKVAGSLVVIRSPLPAEGGAPIPRNALFPGRPPVPVPPVTGPGPNEAPLKRLIDPIYGEGKVELTHTNLAKFGPFAFLYDTAKLFQNVNTLEGHGHVEFHLERGGLRIESMRYFNRGTEIRGVASLSKLWDLPNNPFVASAFLTARPLAGIKLPFISDVDTAFSAIQQSLQLTGVKVVGTLHDYHPVPLLLSEMGQDLKSLFVHDARGE